MRSGNGLLQVVPPFEQMGTTTSAFTNVYYIPTDPALGRKIGFLAFRHSLCNRDTGNVYKVINNNTSLSVPKDTRM